MPGWKFWKSPPDADPGAAAAAISPAAPASRPRTASIASSPPNRPTGTLLSPERRQRRVAELERRRDGLRFEIEQGELAGQADNPWSERIAFLRDALDTIAVDRRRLDQHAPEPTWIVPPVPVTDIVVDASEPASVAFRLADEEFRYTEATDWDNRGGMVVRGDLRRLGGDPAGIALPGAEHPPPSSFLRALTDAIDVFAVVLRDNALDGKPITNAMTLRDIVREDTGAGGWTNRHGTNPVRVRSAFERQELRAESDRLVRQIREEDDQRRTLVDQLPVARKRLASVKDDLAALG